jgi:hypothetical protein
LNGGRRVFAAIRPDDFEVGRGDGVNALPGVVANVEYCGRESLIEVSVAGGLRLHVRTSAPVVPGDRLHLNVPVERVLVYPTEY